LGGSRFDALARSLAQPGRRRRVLVEIAAGALGALGLRGTDAAACRPVGSTCRENANCCSKLCGPRDRTGRQTCACRADADCPAPAVCREVICQDGACVEGRVTGAPCTTRNGTAGSCQDGTCVVPTTTTSTTTSPVPNLQGTCPDGGDNCRSDVSFLTCNDDDVCRCYQRIGGAGTVCGNGATTVCEACDEDADCGAGKYCIAIPTGGDCCQGFSVTSFCAAPCPSASAASALPSGTVPNGDE
jgi:hypothetical protein